MTVRHPESFENAKQRGAISSLPRRSAQWKLRSFPLRAWQQPRRKALPRVATDVDKFIVAPSRFASRLVRENERDGRDGRDGRDELSLSSLLSLSVVPPSISGTLPVRKNVSVVAAYPANKSRRRDSRRVRGVRRPLALFLVVIGFVGERAHQSRNESAKTLFPREK